MDYWLLSIASSRLQVMVAWEEHAVLRNSSVIQIVNKCQSCITIRRPSGSQLRWFSLEFYRISTKLTKDSRITVRRKVAVHFGFWSPSSAGAILPLRVVNIKYMFLHYYYTTWEGTRQCTVYGGRLRRTRIEEGDKKKHEKASSPRLELSTTISRLIYQLRKHGYNNWCKM